MHLLKAQPGVVADGSEAVDLGQTPGDIVVLSAADTELASLAAARESLGEGFPALRLGNVMQLSHHASVDLYCESIVTHARLVVVRLLGGKSYWPYGVEQLVDTCASSGTLLALLPGDDQPDPELLALSTVTPEAYRRLWDYLVHGAAVNARNFLAFAAGLLGRRFDWREPVNLPRAGLYWPGVANPGLADLEARWPGQRPVAALVFYRALVQADNLAPVAALIDALDAAGVNCLPIYCASLKDPVSASMVESLLLEVGGGEGAGVVLNCTGFAVSTPGQSTKPSPLNVGHAPVLQVVFSGGTGEDWAANTRGLSARDIAMNVALPEVDGRLLSRAVSFKGEARFDEATQCSLVVYEPVPDRVDFVARLAASWLRLKTARPAERRIAMVLANYPNRDGRLGNGVGLDTPASAAAMLADLAEAGYTISDIPSDGDALVARLRRGPTNAAAGSREVSHVYSLNRYLDSFQVLPAAIRDSVLDRWGEPREDPFFLPEANGFAMPAFTCGQAVVGLQPARGYNIDPQNSYHDPALVPPHGYLAFYAWLRDEMDVHAVIHVGKHGNLEWLPGKALALSSDCYPEAALGPLPHVYPFIVNDPGEGTQAKRRSQAVIVDHLTPPLTRAETYGPLAELELLVDEYYEASGVDPRRLAVLREQILALAGHTGLDRDCGIGDADDHDEALAKLDNYLCELKEMQIRGGLHEFGRSPSGDWLSDLIVSMTRLPRGGQRAADASLIRALALDLGLSDFDPLDCKLGKVWTGARPRALADLPAPGTGSWRTAGDTVERLEILARSLVDGAVSPDPTWIATSAVLDFIDGQLRNDLLACGPAELGAVRTALDGQFLAPGPSGAPTRGRLDVLPTGRNFYSVDTRTVPTPAAWTLGWKSAALLLDRHRQEHGAWPQTVALSAWGTANMRTGGDDIAQALALMGVRPNWETASRRVTGFTVMPLDVLDRPRVDVTLRISGFFRDAFPAQIDLFDSAVRAVAELDEPPSMNPLAARVREEADRLVAAGSEPQAAARRAAFRVFGSKPGAYGAGLQALIDERGWESGADLARAFVAWGGYAYGAGAQGAAEHRLFEARLAGVEAVLHNQDNREHDLLDSDDYYQFEGGMTVAVRALSGQTPAVYHNDHSRPESPRIRTLKDEIARVVRARVVNPKWIAAMQRHGYKGGFEMAATLDYLFAFAATTGMVENHHFDAVYAAYLEDPKVREFLEQKNDAALREMAQRFLEAIERGLWQPRSNSAASRLEGLAAVRSPPSVTEHR